MNEKDKSLLIKELNKYHKANYRGRSVRSCELKLIIDVVEEFQSRKSAMRLLVENRYGLFGNLIFKHVTSSDAEITELINSLDTKLVNDAYRTFGDSLVPYVCNNCFCMKIILKRNPRLASEGGISLLRNEAFALEVAGYCPQILKAMHFKSRNNREFVRKIVKANPACLEYAEWKFRGDREIAYEAVLNNGDMIRFADYSFRDIKELALSAVRFRGLLLSYVSDRMKDDFDVVKAAVTDNWLALDYASERLKEDKEIRKIAEESRRRINGND